MRRNKSNLDAKLMKSESKEIIAKMIKDRELLRNEFENSQAHDREQAKLQEKLKLMQLDKLPKKLIEAQVKTHSARGVNFMRRVHVLPE